MDTYIVNLIKNNNRVILPDFGAFIVKQDQTKTITFNEFLKFNDGLLISYVAERDNIDKAEAKEKVNTYILNIRENIDNKKRFTIQGLGDLFKDVDNKIQFSPESKGKTTGYAAPEPMEKKEDTKSPVEKKIVPPPVPPKAKSTPEKSTLVDSNKKPASTEELTPKKEPESENTQQKKSQVPPPPPPKKPTNTKQSHTPGQTFKKEGDKDKKGSGKKILIIVLALVLLGAFIAAYFVFFEDNVKDYLANRTESKAQTEKKAEPAKEQEAFGGPMQKGSENQTSTSSKDDPAPSGIQKEKAPAKNTQQNNVATGKQYQVVAGCFIFERNAKNYLEKLQKEGYDARIFGKVGRLHGVSFERYNSRQEAIDALRRIQQQREPRAWIRYQ